MDTSSWQSWHAAVPANFIGLAISRATVEAWWSSVATSERGIRTNLPTSTAATSTPITSPRRLTCSGTLTRDLLPRTRGDPSSPVRSPGAAQRRGGSLLQEADQIAHLVPREARVGHAHAGRHGRHARRVGPHGRSPGGRRLVIASALGEIRLHPPPLAPQAVALEAILPQQDDLPLVQVRPRVPQSVALQVRHQVGHLGGADARPLEPPLRQHSLHGGDVIPEPARELHGALGAAYLLEGEPGPLLAAGHVAADA